MSEPTVGTSARGWSWPTPYLVIGVGCVVAGGLLAAANAVSPSELGSWAAAFLVLVAGVAQVGLGLASALLPPRPPSRRLAVAELLAWNLGCAGVMVGTLLPVVALVDVGGALLLLALVLALRSVRGARGLWLRCFQALVVVLVVSIPVGLVLARL